MFGKTGKRLAQVVGGLATVLLLGAVLSDALAVVFRYGVGQPLIWTEEVQRYLMIWVAFLGSAACISRGDHMAIDLIGEFLPPAARRVQRIVLHALTGVFCFVLAWKGLPLALGNYSQLSPATRVPMTYPYLAVGVGGVLMLAAVCLRIGAEVTERPAPQAVPR
jgi:TRAP-type C4-dicarboxylate transport system permease small subunit